MKNTNKAFTLIELLAVILILGIIALIAIPAVSGIVKESKDSAAKAGAENYSNAAETAVMKKNLTSSFNPTNCDVSKTTLSCDGYSPMELDIKGDLPVTGSITFNNNTVDAYSLTYSDGRTITKSSDGTITSGKEKMYAIGTEIYFDVTTGKECTNYTQSKSALGTKTGCMKWYVYKDNKNGTCGLLLDHNTTAQVAWNTSKNNQDGMNEVAVALANDISSWNSSIKNSARLITADEVADIVGASSKDTLQWSSSKPFGTTVGTESGNFYFDGLKNGVPKAYSNGWQKQYANSSTKSKYAWLFDYTSNCTNYGCNNADGYTFGYWTSSAVSGIPRGAWTVGSNGDLNYVYVDYSPSCGVRPVITVSKSKLS